MRPAPTEASCFHSEVAVAPENVRLERGRPRPRMSLSRKTVILGCLLSAFSGCQTTGPREPSPLVARLHLEARPGEPGVTVHLPVSGLNVTVNPKPVLVEYDLVDAQVAHVELGACLMLQFSPAAARDLYRLSVAGLGRRLVLFLNDEPVGALRIRETMVDGVIYIFVEKPDAELPALVARLRRTAADIVAAAKKSP